MIANALSVDVEEYYHAGIFRRATAGLGATPFESRVEQSLDDLLELLKDHFVKATFFVLGEIAALHPGTIRRIAAEGHEIACHGDRHEDVYRQNPEEFRADLRQAKQRIEDAVGAAVIGYRAPNFSIGRAQCWAYQILLEEGFAYDSSSYPIVHDRYGQHRAPRFPYEIWRDGADRLVEFPVGTVKVFGWNMPIGGGGYFRLAPYALTRLGIHRVNAVEHRPVMFYLHPWELDPGQPRPKMDRLLAFRHYVGVRRQADKLARLFANFHFAPARDVLRGWTPSALPAEPPLRFPAPSEHQARAGRGTSVCVSRFEQPTASAWRPPVREPHRPELSHAAQWAAVIKEAYGHTPLYLVADDDSGNRGILPAFIVRRPILGPIIASMPFLDSGGPRATSSELEAGLLTRLLNEARRIGAHHVHIRASRRLPLAVTPLEHKVRLVLPLTTDPDQVLKKIDRAARSQIRKAERLGLSIDVGGREYLDAFYDVFAVRMHELGSPVHSRAFFDAILDHFGHHASVVIVSKGPTRVGGLIALAYDDELTVPWASCLREYSSLCPNMLLYWATIRTACREGFARFDFGRSTRDSGTYRFKRQWGAQEEPLFWYTIPLTVHQEDTPSTRSGAAAEFAVRAWRQLPLGLTRRLGPGVRRYLIQ
jgi:FemAB-related protein (PEP-CTERM system-associated)